MTRGTISAAATVDATLTFLGAAGEVTGSSFLVETAGLRFLVDCGMFQGQESEQKNAEALAFDVRAIDFVILTHAHIDHSGLLPLLARRGFRGPIHATPATCDLLGVMLPDSAHIQESNAAWARERPRRDPGPRGRQGGRRNADPGDEPLYTLADAQAALRLLERVSYGERHAVGPGVAFTFRDAGHILGSAIVELELGQGAHARRIVFSGDLGQPGRPVLPDPVKVARADALVVESTYGNRLHRTLADTFDEFATVLSTTLPRGNVIVPAFAVGRTQEVLHVLADLARAGRVPPLTVFVDSPLAKAATEITARYAPILDRETRDLAQWQVAHPERMRLLFTETPEDSMRINGIRAGAVIVAASGMCEAGRVRHHLRHNLPREECAVVFTGFQARGTLGRALVDGAKEVRLFREPVPVRASVHTIGGLSAHADQSGLLGWLEGFQSPPARVFVVHGERETSVAFADVMRERLHWPSIETPARGDRHHLAWR
ncbi:MAG: MBL fold metallo-hydrolase [Betaproteobacteria bacterium]|nr:MBL fold metallo-hydrolase [Betaproteobacteria bacterium]